MAQVKVYFDPVGQTLTVWFADPSRSMCAKKPERKSYWWKTAQAGWSALKNSTFPLLRPNPG